MHTIYKYEIPMTGLPSIQMPEGATILHVHTQYDKPCVWVRCKSDAPLVDHIFQVYGTGHPLPMEGQLGQYAGTVHLAGGSLVFHIFYKGEDRD